MDDTGFRAFILYTMSVMIITALITSATYESFLYDMACCLTWFIILDLFFTMLFKMPFMKKTKVLMAKICDFFTKERK